MTSQNPELVMTLDDIVEEVLNTLTGLDLDYDPRLDRYRSVVRSINRALRKNALEHEWSYYADVASIGTAVEGVDQLVMDVAMRPRIVGDDSVRLVDVDGIPRVWAYFLPRDAIHKYRAQPGLWVSSLRNKLIFSRPFTLEEDGMDVQCPVLREPTQFRLPDRPEDPNVAIPQVPDEIRDQPVDFPYPDLIAARAAFHYAQTDPVLQPRVQTLEGEYKDLMYQCIERDDSVTDSTYMNPIILPMTSSLAQRVVRHNHPTADGWSV